MDLARQASGRPASSPPAVAACSWPWRAAPPPSRRCPATGRPRPGAAPPPPRLGRPEPRRATSTARPWRVPSGCGCWWRLPSAGCSTPTAAPAGRGRPPAGEDPRQRGPLGDGVLVTGDGEVFVLRRGASWVTPVGKRINAVASLECAECGCWSMHGGARCGRSACRTGPLAPAGAAFASACPPTRSACSSGPNRRRRDRGALLDPGTGRRPGPVPRGPRGGRRPGPGGLPRAHAGPFTLTDQRTGARHRWPADPARLGRRRAGQPRRPVAGRRVRRPVLGPGEGPGVGHLAARPPDPPLAAAARHAPDHRGQVHEHGMDRRRPPGPGGRLRPLRRGHRCRRPGQDHLALKASTSPTRRLGHLRRLARRRR